MNKSFPFAIINVFSKLKSGALGNPSSVILLDQELADEKLQAVATELNQPATTFLWATETENEFRIRWFAPDAEIGLCGHGAMAATVFLFQHLKLSFTDQIKLVKDDKSINAGKIEGGEHFIELENIKRSDNQAPPAELEKALGQKIIAYHTTNNKQIVLLENEESLLEMQPDFEALRKIDVFGYSVTAPSSKDDDFVCRTIVPHVQQLEDQATGSTQAVLVDFWARRLSKSNLISRQLSKRGGFFKVAHNASNFKLFAESYSSCIGTFFLN